MVSKSTRESNSLFMNMIHIVCDSFMNICLVVANELTDKPLRMKHE